MMPTPKVFCISLLCVAVVIAASVGFYFAVKGNDGKSADLKKAEEDQQNPTPSPSSDLPSATAAPVASVPSSIDPNKETYSVSAFAIGDWGSTVSKPGSCCNRYRKTGTSSPAYYKDLNVQTYTSHLMALEAKKTPPQVIIGHGDNFYWNGVGTKDTKNRFETTFERMYDQPELNKIKWVNVMGNHDYGGSNFICGTGDNKFVECKSKAALLAGLKAKFTLQGNYKSSRNLRWKISSDKGDEYYKYTIKKGDVSMDIFNVDTNASPNHGGPQICCQCYGYAPKFGYNQKTACKNPTKGKKYCLGGDIELYDACINQLNKIFKESLIGFSKDAAKTTSDWKVVNSHYSPHFHMGDNQRKNWHEALAKTKTQLFMNGHTHAVNQGYGKWASGGTHFIENGVGGGIQSQSSGRPPKNTGVDHVWSASGSPYGFFKLAASKNYLKVEFVTFGNGWTFAEDPDETIRGESKILYCYYIPKDGSIGKKCQQ